MYHRDKSGASLTLLVAALFLSAVLKFTTPATAAVVTVFEDGFETDGDITTGDGRYEMINRNDNPENPADHFNRREITSLGTTTRGGTSSGDWKINARDIDRVGVAIGDLEDNEGILVWQDPIDISGVGNLVYHASVAQGGDELEFDNPIAFQYRIDGGEWLTAGGFRGLHTNSPSYIYTGGNFARTQGTVPDRTGPRLSRTFRDWSWPIFGTGSTLELRFFINANGGDEEYGIDNVRIAGDDGLTFFTPSVNTNLFSESAGAGAGELTITLATPEAVDVVFTIGNSDTNMTDVDLPESITVIAGALTATASFDILADGRFDGNEPVIIQISADGYARERVDITVNNINAKPDVQISEIGTVQIGANCADETDPVQDTNNDGVCLEDDEEFFEIVNAESFPVDISFWELWDERGTRHIFKEGTVLPAGGAAVVFGGGEARGSFGGSLAERNSQGNFSFDEDGESTSIRAGSANEAGAFVDEFTYTTELGSTGNSFNRNEKFDSPGEFWDPAQPTARYVNHVDIPDANGVQFTPGFRPDGSAFLTFDDILTVEFGATAAAIVAPGIDMPEDGSLTGTVSLQNAAAAGGIEVSLAAAKNGDEATFPASVTIAAGATSGTFTITGVDDGILDGDREISIWATAQNMQPGVGYVTVTDIADDPFDLVVNEVFGDVFGTESDFNGNGIIEEPLEDQYIEIVNASETNAVDLSGWTLIVGRTDQPEPDLIVHNFKSLTLNPMGSVVVFGGGDPVDLREASEELFGNAAVVVANGSQNGVNITDEGNAIVILEGPGGHAENVFEFNEGPHAKANSAILRNPELTGDTVEVHFDLSSELLLFQIGSPGTQLDGEPWPGNNPGGDLFDGVALGDGWFESAWYGTYNVNFIPWVNHLQHGFQFLVEGAGDGEVFLYDLESGDWWFTGGSLYPSIYSFNRAAWIFYFVDTSGPRRFVDLTTSQLITIP